MSDTPEKKPQARKPRASSAKKAQPGKDSPLNEVLEAEVVEDTVVSTAIAVAYRNDMQVARQNSDAMLATCLDKGLGVNELKVLMELRREEEAYIARRAFVEAMAKVKAKSLIVSRNKVVEYENRDGDKTVYRHASLDAVLDVAVPELSKEGLSHRWDIIPEEGGKIRVRCVITHFMGHSESGAEMAANPDTSGGKNAIQAYGSTVKYLQRYTFMSALGMSDRDPRTDDDGASFKEREYWHPMSEERMATLIAKLEEMRPPASTDKWFENAKARLAKEVGVPSFEKIPNEHYEWCLSLIGQ